MHNKICQEEHLIFDLLEQTFLENQQKGKTICNLY